MEIVATIDGALGTLDKVLGVVKTARTLLKGPDVTADLLDLKSSLLAVKTENLALVEQNHALVKRVHELEQTIARYDDFDVEAKKYELRTLAPGSVAYALKDSAGGGEPPHHLCPTCYGERRKSILQFAKQDFHFDTLSCPRCGTTVRVPNDVKMTVMTAPSRNRFDGF